MVRVLLFSFAMLSVALTCLGCDGGGGSTECVPNAQVSCACLGGFEGVQVCNVDGSAYSTCACTGGQGGSCAPSCGGKVCGEDGCGGSCGSCGAGSSCMNGICTACVSSCSGQNCGDDGCGGSCGSCAAGQGCLDGVCTACTPNCAGKVCGDDGCDSTCGSCLGYEDCISGACICQPDCVGKVCGDDGCGELCGVCGGGQQTCNVYGECECQPACTGKQCGSDGCGGTCGTCGIATACTASGTCEADTVGVTNVLHNFQGQSSSQGLALEGNQAYWAVQGDVFQIDVDTSAVTTLWNKSLGGDAFMVQSCDLYHRYSSYTVKRYDPDTATETTVSECPGSGGSSDALQLLDDQLYFDCNDGLYRAPLYGEDAEPTLVVPFELGSVYGLAYGGGTWVWNAKNPFDPDERVVMYWSGTGTPQQVPGFVPYTTSVTLATDGVRLYAGDSKYSSASPCDGGSYQYTAVVLTTGAQSCLTVADDYDEEVMIHAGYFYFRYSDRIARVPTGGGSIQFVSDAVFEYGGSAFNMEMLGCTIIASGQYQPGGASNDPVLARVDLFSGVGGCASGGVTPATCQEPTAPSLTCDLGDQGAPCVGFDECSPGLYCDTGLFGGVGSYTCSLVCTTQEECGSSATCVPSAFGGGLCASTCDAGAGCCQGAACVPGADVGLDASICMAE